jgi:hypothetical protein
MGPRAKEEGGGEKSVEEKRRERERREKSVGLTIWQMHTCESSRARNIAKCLRLVTYGVGLNNILNRAT